MSFIIDASMAAAWLLPDEFDPSCDTLLQNLVGTPARTPSLFWYEVSNILVMAERRKRIEPGEALLALGRLRRLPIEQTHVARDEDIFALASAHGLSAYDATYLAAALEEKLPLATLDRKLADAARMRSIALLGPLTSS
jgi:predicted nucleic acid-binding protein